MDTPRHADIRKPSGPLRRGWTTGACAAAAAKAAYTALLTGQFPDPVTIRLPKGETPAFALAVEAWSETSARAGVVKDAGDDPDVTHGATVIATVAPGRAGAGVTLRAGEGVGIVTKPGLPVPPGEPAINPVPRRMIREALAEVAAANGAVADVDVEISIPGGAALARQTWNPRLGIVGGLSVLGTTGIVHPYSCAAWIHSIHRGVDVARAAGFPHVGAATGRTSEEALAARYDLPEVARIDMGDFAGGVLKYVRAHPVPRLTLAGGFAKMTKLAQGALDLHSGRSQVDHDWLAARAPDALGKALKGANTASEALAISMQAGHDIAGAVASDALAVSRRVLAETETRLGILVVDRAGAIIAERREA